MNKKYLNKSRAGTRYFNRDNISKIKDLKNLLYDGDSQNYSLKLANRILSLNKKPQNIINLERKDVLIDQHQNNEKINKILKKLRDLCK